MIPGCVHSFTENVRSVADASRDDDGFDYAASDGKHPFEIKVGELWPVHWVQGKPILTDTHQATCMIQANVSSLLVQRAISGPLQAALLVAQTIGAGHLVAVFLYKGFYFPQKKIIAFLPLQPHATNPLNQVAIIHAEEHCRPQKAHHVRLQHEGNLQLKIGRTPHDDNGRSDRRRAMVKWQSS